jgi:hypothetical protein
MVAWLLQGDRHHHKPVTAWSLPANARPEDAGSQISTSRSAATTYRYDTMEAIINTYTAWLLQEGDRHHQVAL